ncbi:M57 family metalloprotease [Aquimarina sp. RZ0]|uniref:M57 family metalloprotease n=1 Tax=Aquimarina sp. RZ0 TaxID=2607730 RepID=UPI0011F2E1D1|nr:M57 family metalloprotease [Aquimarina sp. RZ0]KAA1247937.1 matrixin family metalloprotease [Aquimarina sp. RZ0]
MKYLKISAVFVAAVLMTQCQNEGIEEPQTINASIPDDIMKGLHNMGFDTNNFPVFQKEDGYLVEGDIKVSTETILAASNDKTTTKQTRVNTILKCSEARDITVRNFDIPEIDTQLRNAINDWNNVNGSFLKFRLVNGNEDITIRFDRGNFGEGEFPASNGKPGSEANFDHTLYDEIEDRNKRNKIIRWVLRHELGHNIGFAHTNLDETGAQQISGTPNRDSNSAMNRQSLPVETFQSVNLSNGEKKALRKLYGGKPEDNICS